MTTHAEQVAIREGLPIVRVLPFDLGRIAEGHPMIVSTADGGRVCLRLYTAEEFLAVQHAAAEEFDGDRITMARAVELTRPMGGAA